MSRILIVENQSFFSKALATHLASLGHSFSHAETDTAAKLILENEDFDCVIADAKLGALAGVEFSDWIHKNKPTPVVLMADFADQPDPEKPFGAEDVTLLVKPFTLDGVRTALSQAIPMNSFYAAKTETYSAMVGVPRHSIKKAGVSELNIYHYMDGHPDLLVGRGEGYILEQLDVPSETRFYTDRESLRSLVSTSLVQGKGAAGNTTMAPERRVALMQNMVQIANEQMAVLGASPEFVEAIAQTLATYLKSIEDGAVWEAIADMDGYSRPVYAQTLASTLVCQMIALEMLYSTQDTFKLTTAAMFHDIGLITLDPALVTTPRALLSIRDRHNLDRHVEVGAAILQQSGWVTDEVCTIVLQHHENDAGTGFPRGSKARELHPMARVLRVADEFVLSVMKLGGQRGIPAERALELMKAKPELDQKVVASLNRILVSHLRFSRT